MPHSVSLSQVPTCLVSAPAKSYVSRGARGLSRLTFGVLSVALFASCAEEQAEEPKWMDVAEVQSELDEMSDFEIMNTEPFPSQVAEGRFVNVWANGLARSVYEDVHSDGQPTGGSLPPGAMIVRRIVDADGKWIKDTVLVRQPDGSNPDTQDLWFSETGADGKLRTEDLSATCFTCHAARPDHAFLFGVPLDYAR